MEMASEKKRERYYTDTCGVLETLIENFRLSPTPDNTVAISVGDAIDLARQFRKMQEEDSSDAKQFRYLADLWSAETSFLSDLTAVFMHPAYQRIIGMGKAALPHIFTELRDRSGHWFWALRAITGDDPVAPESAGNIRAMREAWLIYGKRRGYISGELAEIEVADGK